MATNYKEPHTLKELCVENAVFAADSTKLDKIIAEQDLPEISLPRASSEAIRRHEVSMQRFNREIRALVESIYGKKDK